MISPRPPSRPKSLPQRGVALILALLMVVVMTAYSTEFNYSAYINNLSSYHYKDDTRAYYLSKSGIRTYGMLLVFAKQLSGNQMAAGLLAQLGLNIDGPDMLCRSLPFLDTALLRAITQMGGASSEEDKSGLLGLLGIGGGENEQEQQTEFKTRGATDETEEDQEGLRRKLLEFEGDFKVECQDESAKIDLNGFANTRWTALPVQQHPIGQMIFGLVAPPEYNPLFEDRLKIDRWELIGNIKDWVDTDSQRAGIWGGDEDSLYDDFEPRYRAKNSRFDSVAELRMVAGVTDEVWSTFGENFSIHTRNYKINVNAASPTVIRALIRAHTNPLLVSDQVLDNEVVPLLMAERSFIPGPFRNANDFISRVKAKGVAFTDAETENQLKGLLATDSRVFRLRATGYVNDSTRTIDATVRVSSRGVQYLEWREH
ncbi:MAG: hypothetical protein VX498_07470 [Myxococcota bacterium]|nr:hypothetical protein [Myxococcota bacterium]